VFPVKYEQDFYIPEDGSRHSHCSDNFQSGSGNGIHSQCLENVKIRM
jgi:hypothetical protein